MALTKLVNQKFWNSAATAAAVGSEVQRRFLNIHEFQGANLMRDMGVNVPKGIAVSKAEDAAAAAIQLAGKDAGDGEVVVKAQVLAGGRGLGKFQSGLQGGVHIVKASEASAIASKMIGQRLVTKQTGAEGKPCNQVLIAEKMDLKNEMYFALLLDRASAGPIAIACARGGTSIEDLAEQYPDLIIREPINSKTGMTKSQATAIAEKLELKYCKVEDAAEQITRLFKLFIDKDCTMLEINPLAESADGLLIAADAKLNFDDNAEFRQKELFALRDSSQEDPREVQAAKADLNYIGLDGNIGCMVNGAGLAMATMDIISMHGGSPANFLDVGGGANEDQVIKAFELLNADPKVKAILVNIFGGIMRCDTIARGVVSAAGIVDLRVPLVVRLEGTNVEAAKKILADAAEDLKIISADDLDDAASKAVAAASSMK